MEQTVCPRIYRFGPFELAVEAADLRKNGVHLKLQEQPFQILCALLGHPGEIVTREQLRQQLWPEGTFVDFEHGLNTAIKKIRDVLNDDADTPRYIETIPRKGYRFIAPLNHEVPQKAHSGEPPSPKPHSEFRMAGLIVAAVALVGFAFFTIQRLAHPSHLQVFATKQLTFTGDLSPSSTIETDGRQVYYFKYADNRLYSIPVSGGAETSHATGFAEPIILHISPDGSTLLVKENIGPSGGMESRIWLLPTNGGPPRPLGDIEADFAAWSPDGMAIVFSRDKAIYLTENQGTTYRKLLDIPDDVSWIRWSPDGKRLRFSTFDTATSLATTWEASGNGKSGPVAMKLGGAPSATRGFWTRDGRRFLFRDFRDLRHDYWISEETWWPLRRNRPVPLNSGSLEMMAATASPLENRLFAVGSEHSTMTFKFNPAVRQLTQFLPQVSVANPVFSPDGKWMAFCQVHNLESVLWRVRTDASEWLQLTDPKLMVHHARFSPDSKRIALMGAWPDQPWKIYWLPVEGGALHELSSSVVNQADPNWMPGNQSILFGQPPRFWAERDIPRAIYTHSLQSNTSVKVPGSDGWFSPRISPDGRRFLALSIDMHKLSMYEFATSQWRVLLEDSQKRVVSPFWSLDGNWIYANVFVNIYGKNATLMRIRLADGRAEKAASLGDMIASPDCWAFGVAPDASIMITCSRPGNNIYALRYE